MRLRRIVSISILGCFPSFSVTGSLKQHRVLGGGNFFRRLAIASQHASIWILPEWSMNFVREAVAALAMLNQWMYWQNSLDGFYPFVFLKNRLQDPSRLWVIPLWLTAPGILGPVVGCYTLSRGVITEFIKAAVHPQNILKIGPAETSLEKKVQRVIQPSPENPALPWLLPDNYPPFCLRCMWLWGLLEWM